MSEIPDVVPGALITAAYNNDIRDRAVMRYANAAARDASVLVPVAGDIAYLLDIDKLTIYDGSGWVTYATEGFVADVQPQVSTPGDVTLSAGAGSPQLLASLTGVNTSTGIYLVTATAYLETSVGGALVIWDFEIRLASPDRRLALVRQSGTGAFFGALSVTGMTNFADTSGGVELVARRDTVTGVHLVRDITLTSHRLQIR